MTKHPTPMAKACRRLACSTRVKTTMGLSIETLHTVSSFQVPGLWNSVETPQLWGIDRVYITLGQSLRLSTFSILKLVPRYIRLASHPFGSPRQRRTADMEETVMTTTTVLFLSYRRDGTGTSTPLVHPPASSVEGQQSETRSSGR